MRSCINMKCSNFALSGHSGKFKGSNTRQYIFLHKSHFPNTHIHKPCIPIISKRASKKKRSLNCVGSSWIIQEAVNPNAGFKCRKTRHYSRHYDEEPDFKKVLSSSFIICLFQCISCLQRCLSEDACPDACGTEGVGMHLCLSFQLNRGAVWRSSLPMRGEAFWSQIRPRLTRE